MYLRVFGSIPMSSANADRKGFRAGLISWLSLGSIPFIGTYMVYVAQLVECLIVVQEVMGSTPIIHTNSSQRTRLRRMKQDGGMRVVDQNYLYLRSSIEQNLWLRTTRCEFESRRRYNYPFRITEVQHSSKVSGRSSNL
jgi:hypothetical protein